MATEQTAQQQALMLGVRLALVASKLGVDPKVFELLIEAKADELAAVADADSEEISRWVRNNVPEHLRRQPALRPRETSGTTFGRNVFQRAAEDQRQYQEKTSKKGPSAAERLGII